MIYGFFHILLFLIVLEVLLLDVIGRIPQKYYLRSFNASWILLFLIATFRYGVGSDTVNYMVAYKYIPSITDIKLSTFEEYRFSPLYTLINSLGKTISNDFLFIQLFQCTAFFGGLYIVLKQLEIRKIYIILYFYLFLYFMDGMSAMRESFAMGSCFIALYYYHHKRFLGFYIFNIIGFGFHSGAIVFLLLPIIGYLSRYGNRFFYGFILLIIAVVVIGRPYLEEIQLLLMVGDGSVSRYMDAENITGISLTTIIRNVIIIAVIKYCLINNRRNVIRQDYAMLAVICCLLDILAGILPMAFRVASYYQIFVYYTLFQLICVIPKRMLMLKFFVLLLLFYQPITRYISVTNDYGLDPYCSVFSSDKSYYDNAIKGATADDYFK